MTGVGVRPATSRREELARARQSRRPSRLGCPAGGTGAPDRTLDPDSGFPQLLQQVWRDAVAASDLCAAVDILLTLGGHAPAEVSLRALDLPDECALAVLFGLSWRTGDTRPRTRGVAVAGTPAFHGWLGLTVNGRVVVGVPSRAAGGDDELIDGVIRVPWTAAAVTAYADAVGQARATFAREVMDCRTWLERMSQVKRDALLDDLDEASLRTAPFAFYQGARFYTNFRARNNLAGKTLWPGHPDAAMGGLKGLPVSLWSDGDAVVVVCLALLIRSVGFGRIEEANGTQLSIAHVAQLLERTRRTYNAVGLTATTPPAASTRVADLAALAGALRAQRGALAPHVQLYRQIHGPLLHKIERIARPSTSAAESEMCRRLSTRLPLGAATFAEAAAALVADPGWLVRPHGAFDSGLESFIYEIVCAAGGAFRADFAMSRGLRSLPRLLDALQRQDWADIISWELPAFFCCVVPRPGAARWFGGREDQVADAAWAMSARMQYNSWHFIAGNLPRTPEVVARDFFVPPTIPDLAFFSDQHHRGHVAAHVRFSIRSPQAVQIGGRRFVGFVDLRLLRCGGEPFAEADLVAAHRASALIATATGLAADLVDRGAWCEVTAFDSRWHWEHISPRTRCSASTVVTRHD